MQLMKKHDCVKAFKIHLRLLLWEGGHQPPSTGLQEGCPVSCAWDHVHTLTLNVCTHTQKPTRMHAHTQERVQCYGAVDVEQWSCFWSGKC